MDDYTGYQIFNIMFLCNHIANRANQTHQWSPSDSAENYKLIQSDGRPNYTKDSFGYSYNKNGFRCDDFTEHSDLPILFMGCSLTEGIGLPLNEVWSSKLLNRIQSLPQNTNKKIPYWSVAIGGTGFDTASRNLNNFNDQLKPKYIFCLSISYYRREFCFDDVSQFVQWLPNFTPPSNPIPFKMDKLFTDDAYAYYESHRSLSLLNALAEKYGTKICIFDIWHPENTLFETEAIDNLYQDLKNITRYKLTYNGLEQFGEDTSKPILARDGIHPGPNQQTLISHLIWNKLQNSDIFN